MPQGNGGEHGEAHPVIRSMSLTEAMHALDDICHSTRMSNEFFVGAVAYQQAAIEKMERRGFEV